MSDIARFRGRGTAPASPMAMTVWIFLTWIWVPSGWGPVPLSKSVMGPYPTVAVCEAARSEILSVADDDWRVYVGQCRKKE